MTNKQVRVRVRVWVRVRVSNNVLIGEKQADVDAMMIFLMLTYINFNLAFISSFMTFFSVAFFSITFFRGFIFRGFFHLDSNSTPDCQRAGDSPAGRSGRNQPCGICP